MPSRFWVFAGFALLYGIVETVNGNWSTVYMSTDLGASATTASLALAAFWGMVTIGRVLFAAIERQLPEATTYRALPFVAAAALFITALLPSGSAELGVLSFGLAGLGCSALLPLTIGFAELELTVIATSVAGLLIALYQVGYGIAAFGVGPLVSAGVGLGSIFLLTALVALAMGALSFVVIRNVRSRPPDVCSSPPPPSNHGDSDRLIARHPAQGDHAHVAQGQGRHRHRR